MRHPCPKVLPKSVMCPDARGSACIRELAEHAGGWKVTPTSAPDAWDEVTRQREIHGAAIAVVETMREVLLALAERSRAHSRMVACDQHDWGATIADGLADLVGDTFGCLPEAIARACRELTITESRADMRVRRSRKPTSADQSPL